MPGSFEIEDKLAKDVNGIRLDFKLMRQGNS